MGVFAALVAVSPRMALPLAVSRLYWPTVQVHQPQVGARDCVIRRPDGPETGV